MVGRRSRWPAAPVQRRRGRNAGWWHFNTAHVLSVPDTWEYPCVAAWDLAFHCLPLAFGELNPPVHAWAVWRVYQIDRQLHGVADRAFLEGVFHKLLLTFTGGSIVRTQPD